MAGLLRKYFKQFGTALTPTGNIAQFGSLNAGSPVYSSDPEVIQAGAAWPNGWNGALVGNRSPAKQDLNGLGYQMSYALAYLLTRGIPEWNVLTTYNTGDIARVGAVIWSSATDNNIGNTPGVSNWTNLFGLATGPGLCRAWATFDGINSAGGNATLISAFNVSTVTKVATGQYRLNFTNPMPDALYTIAGSCGTQDAQGAGTADSAHVSFGFTGVTGVKSTTQANVFAVQNSTLVNPGAVTVQIFGGAT